MSPASLLLDPDHLDALQEIVNIGMGQAGALLASVLDAFVQLSVPRIRLVRVEEIGEAITTVLHTRGPITAVRQAFFDGLRGEAITIFGDGAAQGAHELLGCPSLGRPAASRGQLLDLSNIVTGACLGGIGAQLSLDIVLSRPSLLAQHVLPEELFAGRPLAWSTGLLVEVHFGLVPQTSFLCHLVTLLQEEEVTTVQRAVDQFLAAL